MYLLSFWQKASKSNFNFLFSFYIFKKKKKKMQISYLLLGVFISGKDAFRSNCWLNLWLKLFYVYLDFYVFGFAAYCLLRIKTALYIYIYIYIFIYIYFSITANFFFFYTYRTLITFKSIIQFASPLQKLLAFWCVLLILLENYWCRVWFFCMDIFGSLNFECKGFWPFMIGVVGLYYILFVYLDLYKIYLG